MNRPFFLLFALVLALGAAVPAQGAAPPAPPAPGALRIATWNIENLFDAEDDPGNPGDDEYTPGSWRRWTDERYQAKARNIAAVVAEMRPDILFLAEVENRAVLTNLVHLLETLPAPHPMPHIAHVDSPSRRGIDVAILSRHPLGDVTLHTPVPFMRGILEATATIDGTKVTCYACHWKSWVGDAEENIALRQREALAVRALAERRLADDPDAMFAIGGDFNDNCDGASLRTSLRAVASRDALAAEDGEPRLYHLVGEIPEAERGTYYFARRKVWNTFDGIVIPPAVLRPASEPGPAWRLSPEKPNVGVYKSALCAEEDGRPKPFRRVRKKDGTDEYMEGCSDHFPLWADFVRARRSGE